MERCRLFVFLLVLVWALVGSDSPIRADEQVHKAPAENWAEMVGIPELDPARSAEIRNGIAYLLADTQIRHREGGYSVFERLAYKVTDRPGLESGARLDIEFDPSRHKLFFNRLAIIRDGVVIDKLPEAEFEIFRRETDSERGIFDGRLTAHVDLSDVRVGDIALGPPVHKSHKVTVTNLKARFTLSENADVHDPRASLRVSWSSLPTEFELEWRFRTQGQVPLEDIGAYLKAADSIERNSAWNFDFTYVDPVDRSSINPSGVGIAALVGIGIAMPVAIVAAIRDLDLSAETDERGALGVEVRP